MARKLSFEDQLVSKMVPLEKYACVLTRDRMLARDLVQDTLARALAKRHLYRPGTNLLSWLFTIMKNTRVNNVRSYVRRGVETEVDEVRLAAPDNPEVALHVRDLAAALARLSEEQREVIRLICYRGMSYVETAAAIDIPLGTVRSRLSRARDELRWMM